MIQVNRIYLIFNLVHFYWTVVDLYLYYCPINILNRLIISVFIDKISFLVKLLLNFIVSISY